MKDESFDYDCDYLVVGGGATGMAFADTLLNQYSITTNNNNNNNNDSNNNDHHPSVIVVDQHESPGGQWHDSYDFVQLHQPSKGYGVESKELAAPNNNNSDTDTDTDTDTTSNNNNHHRATRSEILAYYNTVKTDLESNHDFQFLGGTTLDRLQLLDGNSSRQDYTITQHSTSNTPGSNTSRTIRVRKRLVDARNLEPDLPVSTLPKFAYNSETVTVLPVNDIANNSNTNQTSTSTSKKHFVVVGGGKTGMDAVHHLLTEKQISPQNLLWVVPNDAWITAREKIGNCIDLLYESAKLHNNSDATAAAAAAPLSDDDADADEKKEADGTAVVAPKKIPADFFQKGFVAWEQQGHIYRLDPSVVPTKFKDATLSLEELGRLQTAVPRIVRKGRISKITDRGTMVFVDGSTVELPFPVQDTLFVHCAAGAFHCSKSVTTPPPIFEHHKIVVQDIYGTPGFCFVGSMIAKLESMPELSDDDRNAMTRFPKPPPPPSPSNTNNNDNPLGKSDGDVLGAVSGDHPYIQRARNLKAWIELGPPLRDWLFANRLFHLKGADPNSVLEKLDFIFGVLRRNGIES